MVCNAKPHSFDNVWKRALHFVLGSWVEMNMYNVLYYMYSKANFHLKFYRSTQRTTFFDYVLFSCDSHREPFCFKIYQTR